MRKCKECGSSNWEIVVPNFKGDKDLWQCSKCKRVVCTTFENLDGEGKI